jgi:hypothetical protein
MAAPEEVPAWAYAYDRAALALPSETQEAQQTGQASSSRRVRFAVQ